MKARFIKWISENKSGITKPDKYANTIVTISNHFGKQLAKEID